MNRKNLPLVMMLTAGLVTSIITFICKYSTLRKLVYLFVVLILFFVLGTVMKMTLDHFDRQNEKKKQEEGLVIEKESGESEEANNTSSDK